MEFDEAWDHAVSTVGLAARRGNLTGLQKLVEEDGKPVDVADNRGWRPLHEAANKNHADCVQYLLSLENVDINWQTFKSETALHLACEANNKEVVQLLLIYGADCNVKDDDWRTPLITAVTKSANEVVCLLLEHNVDVNASDINEWTALHFAVDYADVQLVKLLLKYNADFRLRDEHGRNSIFIAAEKSFECLKLLVELANSKGEWALINDIANDGANPLIIAAQKGNIEVVNFLLDNGADVNQLTIDGCLALHSAVAVADNVECVNLLLEKTNLQILKKSGVRDLIHIAVANQSHKSLEVLLKTNLPIDNEWKMPLDDESLLPYRTMSGYENSLFRKENITFTPLGRAVFLNDSMCVEMLLHHGANPNSISMVCMAPLTLLCKFWNQELLMTLLKAGSRVNYSKWCWCKSEIAILAILFKQLDILKTLITAGVDDIKYVYNDCGFVSRFIIFRAGPFLHDFLQVAEGRLQWTTWLHFLQHATAESTTNIVFEEKDLRQLAAQPPSLKHFSRMKMRSVIMSMGASSIYNVNVSELSLPKELEKYILFE